MYIKNLTPTLSRFEILNDTTLILIIVKYLDLTKIMKSMNDDFLNFEKFQIFINKYKFIINDWFFIRPGHKSK